MPRYARVLLLVGSLCAPASALEFVRDGQPVATVVVKGATEHRGRGRRRGWDDASAARVLVDWVKKITDAELPIVEAAPDAGPVVLIGAAAGLSLDGIDSPSAEGFRIVCDDQKLRIAGQCGNATTKAVCRLLEELGCRYFMDAPIGEVFPRTRTLSVGRLDIQDKPGFLYRSIWGSQWTGNSLWKVWNGAGGVRLSTQHAWGQYIDRKLFDTHPEYFPLRDGKRVSSTWLCSSNADVERLFAEGVARTIEGGNTNPSISPPDGTGYCQCDACRKLDDPNSIEPSSGRVNVTNRYVRFFHGVAERVAAKHPQSILNFYCYADYTQPPTLETKLHPNLCAWVAPIRYCRYHRIGHAGCPSRKQLATMLGGWSRVVSRIAYRTYNYNLAECIVPFSLCSVWAHDVPWLKAKGCIGINLETLANWEVYGPHMYLSIRLAYEPDADAKAIMDDYFAGFYGPRAGPLMKQYWTAIDEAFEQMRCHTGSVFAAHLVYTPEFLAKLKGLLDRAATAAKGDAKHSARVELTRQGYQNAVEFVQVRDSMNRGDFVKAKRVYEALYARNEVEMKKGYGNHYTLNYLRRFVGTHVLAGAAATALPNRRVAVLPDKWRMALDPEDEGLGKGYAKVDFDDAAWKQVATFSNPLDAQGLPDEKTILWYRVAFDAPKAERLVLFFTEIDGVATVYVNGQEVGGPFKGRRPFEVDVAKAARAGRNIAAVRVDHRRISELFLGGIIRPVVLIEKGQ